MGVYNPAATGRMSNVGRTGFLLPLLLRVMAAPQVASPTPEALAGIMGQGMLLISMELQAATVETNMAWEKQLPNLTVGAPDMGLEAMVDWAPHRHRMKTELPCSVGPANVCSSEHNDLEELLRHMEPTMDNTIQQHLEKPVQLTAAARMRLTPTGS